VADFAPAHRCTASDTVKDSSVIIACNAPPARCSVAAMVAASFSKRSQHLDGQLLQVIAAGDPRTPSLSPTEKL
jgi:hypothetical protein